MSTEPFFMVPKAGHDAILEKVEGTDGAFCVSVFVALRKLANDAHCSDGPVSLTINQIAGAAGCRYRKAFDVLRVLRAIGVIDITSQKITGTNSHAPSLYTLCTISRTLCTDRTPIRAEITKDLKDQKEPCAVGEKKAAAKPRKRNELLDTLASLDGSDLAQITRSAWSGAAKALEDIRLVCPAVTPEEIRRRAARYREKFPGAAITPHALAKHWGALDRPAETVRLGSNLQ